MILLAMWDDLSTLLGMHPKLKQRFLVPISHEQEVELWHKRYSDFNYKNLSQLNSKGIVIGVPKV